MWVGRQIERVASEVNLTPEQTERIKPIVRENIDDLVKLRRQAFDVIDRMGKQIAAELTPEQRVKYEQILQARREARQQAHEQRNARRRAENPPPEDGKPGPVKPGAAPEGGPPPSAKPSGN
jgi:hypothetical protein